MDRCSVFDVAVNSGGGGGGGGGGSDGAGGLLKLRDDVEMCGYRDVEVMWNMLNIKQMQKMEVEGRGRVRVKVKVKLKVKNGKGSSKQRPVWRLLFWTNHSP
ncbi:uncharacterized protein LOC129319891 [Prosopis cineraria]|uniref:uncharacterized protein LOC129319891 n=1 Tax=Prosopis cineraria TaxID=364024 RepID=UPI00241001D4|nr:uncharacterized protein LOC129319891 [Prosopis cineraria]